MQGQQHSNKGIEINTNVLRATYIERGYTQKRLAEELGVTANTIQNWLKGDSNPNTENFIKLCDLLDIEPALMTMDSTQLISESKHFKLVQYHTRQLLGLNDPASYKEIRIVEHDLLYDQQIQQSETTVKSGQWTIFDNNDEMNDEEEEQGADVM